LVAHCYGAIRLISIDVGSSCGSDRGFRTLEEPTWAPSGQHWPVTGSHDGIGDAAQRRPGLACQYMPAHYAHVHARFFRDEVNCWRRLTLHRFSLDLKSCRPQQPFSPSTYACLRAA
jgi:hypothetical protein